jgi:hypothetical protein
MRKQLDQSEIEERAATAQALLNDPVVEEALDDLSMTYLNNLMESEIGSQEANAAHAGMKVLNDFKASLLAMVTEKKMRQKYGRSDRDA